MRKSKGIIYAQVGYDEDDLLKTIITVLTPKSIFLVVAPMGDQIFKLLKYYY